ncbi:MAG TPA: hypothetical protein VH561_15960 [Micromonosporaceae bacterium]
MNAWVRPVEIWRLAAGVVLALAGVAVSVLAAVSIVPALHRLDEATREPDAWPRYQIVDHPETGWQLGAAGREVVVAGVILAVVGVVLALDVGGRARLLLSGAAAGSAIFLLEGAQPWMSRALPAWITPVIATLPVLLGVAAVLLAMAVAPLSDPTRLRVGVITAAAVGVAVAALDWWRFQYPGSPLGVALAALLLVPPVLLSGIVVACTSVAGLRYEAWRGWAYAGLGVLLPVVAILVEAVATFYAIRRGSGFWQGGAILGALLAAIAIPSLLGRPAGVVGELADRLD